MHFRIDFLRFMVSLAVLLATMPSGPGGTAAAQAVTVGPTLNAVVGNRTQGYSGDGGPASDAELSIPGSIVFDSSGNLYIADQGNDAVRKVAAGTGIITTVAGTGTVGFSGDGGPAASAQLDGSIWLAIDTSGNLYIADAYNQRIRKVAAGTGIITTVAGNGTQGYRGDGGPAIAAELDTPLSVAVDNAGNLYIVDRINSRVRKVAASTGIITTVAGNGTEGYSGDGGPATSAEISPQGVAIDAAGNLYISNSQFDGNIPETSIRRVSAATGIITTVAGDGMQGYRGDRGPATSARLASPWGMAFDSAGNLYIADSFNSVVREVNAATGIITTVAGNRLNGFSGGTITSSELAFVSDVAFDPAGNLYISDGGNNAVRAMSPAPYTLTLPRYPANETSEPLVVPLVVNTSGTIINSITAPGLQGNMREFYVDSTGCTLNAPLTTGTVCNVSVKFSPSYTGERAAPLQVATSAGRFNFGMQGLATGPQVALTPGTITTVAGNGMKGFRGNGGPALSAEFDAPDAIALDSTGNLYISDNGNNQVRLVDAATGIVTNVAGSESCGSPSSSALCPALNSPSGLALDSARNLYIADQNNNVIRKVSAATGMVTTVAGDGSKGFSGDGGPATGAQLSGPADVQVDKMGNLYISDTGNYRIRKVAATTGIITTIAGNGSQGSSGDGAPATSAELVGPGAMAMNDAGDLYFADVSATNSPGGTIRMIAAANGIITTVAGDGTSGYSGDGGPAIDAELNGPSGIALDSASDLYIADSGNSVVRVVSSANGIIATVAGDGKEGNIGDGGPATGAEISPRGIALDGAGNIYMANSSYNSVRKVDVTAGLLNFATTPVGSTSSDSPRTAIFMDIGNGTARGYGSDNVAGPNGENEELKLFVPKSGPNPTISNTSFILSQSGTCPRLDATSPSEGMLYPGDSCTLLFSFHPTMAGNISGTSIYLDNALNRKAENPAAQTIFLNGATPGDGTGGNPLANFTLSATPASQAVSPGSIAKYTISVSGTNGFTDPVILTATGLPPGAKLNIAPATVTVLGSGAETAILMVRTASSQAQSTRMQNPLSRSGGPPLRYGLLLLPLPLLGIARLRKRLRALPGMIMLLLFGLLGLGSLAGLTGCANIGLRADPQSYTITVTGSGGGLQRSTTLLLAVNRYTLTKYK